MVRSWPLTALAIRHPARVGSIDQREFGRSLRHGFPRIRDDFEGNVQPSGRIIISNK
jgi:hypothetical protein